MKGKVATAILISGRGSNMASLIQAATKKDFPARIDLVISNRADAVGLDFAKQHRIATKVFNHNDYTDRLHFDQALSGALEEHSIEFICLAGFMRILTPDFIAKWHGRLINIHPSLLPLFKGLNTHKRALEAGVEEHGCTIHYVSEIMDDGPIIAQSVVRVLPGDTPQTLAARVLEREHLLYPKVLEQLAKRILAS